MFMDNDDQPKEASPSKGRAPEDSPREGPAEPPGIQGKIDDIVIRARQKKEDAISQEDKKGQDAAKKDDSAIKRILTKETPTRFDEPITQEEINALIKEKKEKDGYL